MIVNSKRNSMFNAPRTLANQHAPRAVALVVVILTCGLVGLFAVAIIKGQQRSQTIDLLQERQAVADLAAHGATHRAVALLRRDPSLRGNITIAGPEALSGVITSLSVSPRPDGRLLVMANCQFAGTSVTRSLVVDPARLPALPPP